MTLRDSARYRREVEAVAAYYETIRLPLALDFLVCLEEARARLAAHPLTYHERKEGVRLVILRRFPYALRFRLAASRRAVRVLSLTHTARKPE